MANQRPIKSLSDLMDGGVEERFNQELERRSLNGFGITCATPTPRQRQPARSP